MEARKKVAIYIDYALRIPNFVETYEVFKAELYSDKNFDVDTEDEIIENDIRAYWETQLKDKSIEEFYLKTKVVGEEYDYRDKPWQDFFYNREHYQKFLDDYSFNLFTDCEVPNSQDIDIINIAQVKLFDVVLVDRYDSKRKVSNTFFFLSKSRIYPQSVVLLGKGQILSEKNYIGVWDATKNKDQFNKIKDKTFLNWFMELEKKCN